MATKLTNISVDEGSLVDKGANPGALVMLFKRETQKAKWSAAFINDLPDSSFAAISSGGEKDEDGKTTPRSLRHLPYKDGGGKIDLAHLRNALARLDQTDILDDLKAKAKARLEAAAKEAGVGVEKTFGERIVDVFKNMFGYEEGAKQFDDVLADRTRQDEMWKLDDALRQSVCSILDDDEIENKREAVGQALQQYFSALIDTGILKKEGDMTLADVKAMMDKAVAAMASMMSDGKGKMSDGMKGKEMKKGESMPITDEVRNSLPEEVQKHLKEVEAKAAEADELANKVAELEADSGEPEEDITKGMSEDVRKRFEDMQTRIDQAEKDAAAERDARLEREYLTKAEEMPYAGSSEDVVKILRTAYEVSDEHGQLVEKNLRASSERIEKGDLFKEIGRGGQSESDPNVRLQKMAEAKAQEDGTTFEVAYAKVLSTPEGKQLYAERSKV